MEALEESDNKDKGQESKRDTDHDDISDIISVMETAARVDGLKSAQDPSPPNIVPETEVVQRNEHVSIVSARINVCNSTASSNMRTYYYPKSTKSSVGLQERQQCVSINMEV